MMNHTKTAQLRKPRKLKNRFQNEPTKKKFECRTITNPIELMKMGYTPSKKVAPTNQVEISEILKQVA
jgi:hypothetical protein